MIAFDLQCSKGHVFEGWFDNLESYEKQNSMKLVSCPHCNDNKIKRVLSPVTSIKSASVQLPGNDDGKINYKQLAKEMVNYINREFEDLGTGFAKEALKIHYGVSKERNIRGSATENEESILREEGVQFFKIPLLKADDDKKN
ncbi:MAG: DUF1178 family protein [Deltaproteobacteria bacterium]|nr:DUF1178 family protein [Deltaproteobacteria bacterium]